jgi:hypothetical protein
MPNTHTLYPYSKPGVTALLPPTQLLPYPLKTRTLVEGTGF